MFKKEGQAILIVDDQSNWRELFSELLTDKYEVIGTDSYEKALGILEQSRPFYAAIVDINLDDKNLANEDGLRLITALNKRERPINTIVVTGYPTIRTVKEALHELGAFDYVEKYPASGEGFSNEGFRKVVRDAVKNAVSRQSRLTYVVIRIEGLTRDMTLKLGQHYNLILEFQDTPSGDALEVRLPPKGKRLSLKVSINVLNIKVQPADTVFWEIPAKGIPVPLQMKLIPKLSGKETIFIDLEMDRDWIGGIEKEVNVLEETGESD